MDVEHTEASLLQGKLSLRVLESLSTWRDVVVEGDLPADLFNCTSSYLI